jgi:hypothetical protein
MPKGPDERPLRLPRLLVTGGLSGEAGTRITRAKSMERTRKSALAAGVGLTATDVTTFVILLGTTDGGPVACTWRVLCGWLPPKVPAVTVAASPTTRRVGVGTRAEGVTGGAPTAIRCRTRSRSTSIAKRENDVFSEVLTDALVDATTASLVFPGGTGAAETTDADINDAADADAVITPLVLRL